MKFNFFVKKGRPTLVEKEVCSKISNLLKEGVITDSQINEYISENGITSSFEELEVLYAHLTGEVPLDDLSSTSIYNDYNDEKINNDLEIEDYVEQELEDKSNFNKEEKMSEEFNPFEQKVVERDYTKGVVDNVDESLYEDTKVIEDFDDDSVADYQSFEEEEDIPQVEFNMEEEDELIDDTDDSENRGSKLAEGNLQDLSPAQKRKSAEKTADAILGIYCQFIPAPFKSFASFKDRKITELSLKKEIDLEMELDGDVTVGEYIKNQNTQIEEIFTVSEQQKQEIREPLIDVLLEQELALTPTQRLLMAVGGHVVTMGIASYQLSQNNKMALETFKQFQADKMMSYQAPAPQYSQQQRPQTQQQTTTQQPKPQPQTQTQPKAQSTIKEEPKTVSFADVNDNNYEEMTAFDTKIAKDIMDIIDAEHDPSVTVEDTNED